MNPRLLVPALLLPAALAACGGATAEPLSRPDETRTIVHAGGSTDVPVDPQRIVTTTDQNALLPLLELGITPVGSAGLLGDDGSQTFRRTEGFDTEGVEFIGAYGEPNLEEVASLQPDLVVGYELDEDFADELSAIAPTVLVQVFDRPLSEALEQFAEVVGRGQQAAELRQHYEARVEELRSRLGDRMDTLSVSVLAAGDPGTFYREDLGQALGTVTHDLGVRRVAAQQADTAGEHLSLEQLSTRDADVVLLVDYSSETGGVDPATQVLLDSPVWQRLAAVRAGQAHVVDGTKSVGAAWSRMGAFLDVLEQHLVDARDDVVPEG